MRSRFSRRLGHHVGWFYDETYRTNIYLIWNVSPKQVSEFMTWQFGVAYEKTSLFAAKCLEVVDPNSTNSEGPFVIAINQWKADAKGWSMLAHEALHATGMILRNRGLKFADETDEAYCYLMESIVRRCGELLHKKK